jgi:hypothetical protein
MSLVGTRFVREAAAGAVLVALSLGSPPAGAGDEPNANGALEIKKACVAWHEQAQVLRRASSLIEARAALLSCSQDACPVAVRADCAEWLGALTDAIPSVVVRAKSFEKDESDVRVYCDANLIASHLDGRAVELNPGLHTFRFEAPGHDTIEEQVLVVEGEKNRILMVSFGGAAGQPGVHDQSSGANAGTPAPTGPLLRPIPKLDFVLVGAAALAAGSFAGFGVWGLNDKSSLESSCQPVCSQSQIDSVRTKFIVADVSLAVALLSLGTAGYVYVTRPAVEPAAAPGTGARPVAWLTVGAGPSGASLELEGGF